MNIKKSNIALALTGVLFMAMPLSSAFAHEDHCDIKETQLGETMKHLKSELRAYVKSFKKEDTEMMQQHLNELLKLSDLAAKETPVKIKNMQHMMAEGNMPKMHGEDMEHGNMEGMVHDMASMPAMEGMTQQQHHQHMMYSEGITELQGLFNELKQTKDKAQIKAILGKIKEHSKKSHQQFRQDCD